MTNLGPGTLKIGATGSEMDASCLVNGCRITAEKDEGDSVTKLCGDQVPGSVTYTANLAGNMDVDSADATGLFALSWSAPGSTQLFEFVPNTADGTAAKGSLLLDPLDFGADAYGDPMTSDFTFRVVGDVAFTFVGGATAIFKTGIPIPQARIDRAA